MPKTTFVRKPCTLDDVRTRAAQIKERHGGGVCFKFGEFVAKIFGHGGGIVYHAGCLVNARYIFRKNHRYLLCHLGIGLRRLVFKRDIA